MKRAWGVILAIVLIVILLGAILIGVGMLLRADVNTILGVMENSPAFTFVQTMLNYWEQIVQAVNEVL